VPLARCLAELGQGEGSGLYDTCALVQQAAPLAPHAEWPACRSPDPVAAAAVGIQRLLASAAHGLLPSGFPRARLPDDQASPRPNLVPPLATVVSPDGERVYVAYPYLPHCAEDVLRFSPAALADDISVRLMLYEVLHGLGALHGLGLHHGGVSPARVLLTEDRWPLRPAASCVAAWQVQMSVLT
jgi:hypothetical protein